MEPLTFEHFVLNFKTLDVDQYQDFIDARLNILNKEKNSQQQFGPNDIKMGFINDRTPIFPGEGTYPLFLDDASVYLEYLEFLKNRNIPNIYALLNSIQQFVSSKFGLRGNTKAHFDKYWAMLEILGEEKNSVSIKEFYGNNIAMCFERSALVQNLLSFSGVSSTMICGVLKTPATEELHAFNIIEQNDKRILFDVTNPLIATAKDKKRLFPAIMNITTEDIQLMFDYGFMKKVIGNTAILDDESPRIYTFPSKIYELELPTGVKK